VTYSAEGKAETRALHEITLKIPEGGLVVALGASGCGKTSLLNVMAGFQKLSSGQATFEGRPITGPGRDRGVVFQKDTLYPWLNVRDNVAFGLEIRGLGKAPRREIAEHKLELVQLAGWGDRYPDELSGGMQQRVGLARALAADPDILLMDEPFSALDPLIRRELQDQFLELSRSVGKTTVFITHDLEEAIKLGNHIGIMRDGRIIQIGTPEEIVGRPADDYVADFVRGVSRLKLLRAEHIMQPLSGEAIAAGQARARPETGLETLIDLMIRTPGGIAIETEAAKPVGMITLEGLLRAIRGTSPTP
jgi:glycine betaine/proline transport system ATP-binding protein